MIDPKVVEALVAARSRAERSPLNDSPRASSRCSPRSPRARATPRSPSSLFLTKRAVEKHINAIFWKLGLADAADVSKRVKAALMFLAEETPPPGQLSRGVSVA